MKIRKYDPSKDFSTLLNILISEGEEWSCYSSEENRKRYIEALESSLVFVAEKNGEVVGYSRSLIDEGYHVFICDLLVHKEHRGQEIGRRLMEKLISEYPDYEVYVMSDVDPYYEKLGYRNEGTLFRVSSKQ